MFVWLLGCVVAPPDTGDSVAPPVCPVRSGLDRAADQAWQVHSDSDELAEGAWTRAVSWDDDRAVVRRQGAVIGHEGNEVSFDEVREYRCDDDGLWWLRRELTLQLPDRTSVEETDWDEPPLLLKKGLTQDATWSGRETYVLTINGEPDAPAGHDYTIELGAPVHVTVPAGTFEVVPWRKGQQFELLAEHEGVVRDLDGERVR